MGITEKLTNVANILEKIKKNKGTKKKMRCPPLKINLIIICRKSTVLRVLESSLFPQSEEQFTLRDH